MTGRLAGDECHIAERHLLAVEIDLPLHRTEDLKRTERFRELEQVVLDKIRAQAKGGNVRITT